MSRIEQVRKKYWGTMAQTYDQRRMGTDKWREENRVMTALLAKIPDGSTILDIPVGTGRFFGMYGDRFNVIGMDISEDMLGFAKSKKRSDKISLRRGDIFNLDLADKSVDVTVSMRIMNQWQTPYEPIPHCPETKKALRELMRVTRHQIIFNLRVWQPGSKYRRATPIETVEEALLPGWRLTENLKIHQPDFRMLCLNSETNTSGA